MSVNEPSDRFDLDWDDHRRRHLRRQHRLHGDVADRTPVAIDPEKDLLGSIYKVPDAMWGFWAPFRDWHPGVCVFFNRTTRRVTLVKGTSLTGRGSGGPTTVVIEPTPDNGLEVPTAFNLLEVRQYRPRRVALLHEERRLGRIEPTVLAELHNYVWRAFGEMDVAASKGLRGSPAKKATDLSTEYELLLEELESAGIQLKQSLRV
jgi:hypothetical protein